MSACFYAGIDTVLLGSSISIKIIETGGGGASGTAVLSGRFFHLHELTAAGVNWLAIVSELTTALNALGLSATYAVSFDQTTGKYTISASGGAVTSFEITFLNTTTKNVLGFTATVSGALTYTSPVRCYYAIIGTEGCVTEYSDLREVDDELQADLIAFDGSWAEGLSKPGAIRDFALEVPYEPRSAIWADEATVAVPWTWEHWFPHLRTGVPFVVEVAGLFPASRSAMGCVATKARCAFRPKLLGGDFLAYASIPIQAFFVGVAQV